MAGHSILIVEDEFIVAYEIKQTLEDRGFTVCGVVGSGEEAVAVAQRRRPNCVLMDVNIRGRMDGVAAARHIRRHYGIPVAFVSGFPAQEVMAQARDVVPIACFTKPLDFDEVCTVLDERLGTGDGGAESSGEAS